MRCFCLQFFVKSKSVIKNLKVLSVFSTLVTDYVILKNIISYTKNSEIIPGVILFCKSLHQYFSKFIDVNFSDYFAIEFAIFFFD